MAHAFLSADVFKHCWDQYGRDEFVNVSDIGKGLWYFAEAKVRLGLMDVSCRLVD